MTSRAGRPPRSAARQDFTRGRPTATRPTVPNLAPVLLAQEESEETSSIVPSLEVAFHAALFPADGLASINDVGTRIALWVSAFEVLWSSGWRR